MLQTYHPENYVLFQILFQHSLGAENKHDGDMNIEREMKLLDYNIYYKRENKHTYIKTFIYILGKDSIKHIQGT